MRQTRIPYPPITREEFLAYEEVRRSGLASIWDVATVSQLSGFDPTTVVTIMEHYDELVEKYLLAD